MKTDALILQENCQIATTEDIQQDAKSSITTAHMVTPVRSTPTRSISSGTAKATVRYREITTKLDPVTSDDDLDAATVWFKEKLTHAIRPHDPQRRRCDAMIEAIKTLPPEWGSLDIERPNDTAVANARWVLGEVLSQGLTPRHVEPSTGEGICISFLRGIDYADIECFNSGDIISSISPSNAPSEFWDMRDLGLSGTVHRIKGFITGE